MDTKTLMQPDGAIYNLAKTVIEAFDANSKSISTRGKKGLRFLKSLRRQYRAESIEQFIATINQDLLMYCLMLHYGGLFGAKVIIDDLAETYVIFEQKAIDGTDIKECFCSQENKIKLNPFWFDSTENGYEYHLDIDFTIFPELL